MITWFSYISPHRVSTQLAKHINMILKGLDITRFIANLKKITTVLKLNIYVSGSLLPSSIVNYEAVWK